MSGDAVLLIGHGSVEDPSDIAEFVRVIRRGRPTPASLIDEVTHRWHAIGGSPLLEITRAQAAALEQRLGVPVAVGMRLWKPWARDAVRDLAERGVERVVSLPLAPYSTHVYHPTSEEACRAASVSCVRVPAWNEEPALIEAFAEVTREQLTHDAHVLFTAHSLPRQVVESGDPYERLVRATAARVAARAGVTQWSVAFQSQGADGGDWLGPDLAAAFASIHASGARTVVVTAIGFLADHTEILWDLDVDARALAERAGLAFRRSASLNVHPRLVDALESVARRALAE